MTEKMHPSKVAEAHYRRGYMHGAAAALMSAIQLTNNEQALEPLAQWIENDLYKWRHVDFRHQDELDYLHDQSIWPPNSPLIGGRT